MCTIEAAMRRIKKGSECMFVYTEPSSCPAVLSPHKEENKFKTYVSVVTFEEGTFKGYVAQIACCVTIIT